jgi:hypothetical protein
MTPNQPGPTDPPRRRRTLFTLRGPATLVVWVPWLVGIWTIAAWLCELRP